MRITKIKNNRVVYCHETDERDTVGNGYCNFVETVNMDEHLIFLESILYGERWLGMRLVRRNV